MQDPSLCHAAQLHYSCDCRYHSPQTQHNSESIPAIATTSNSFTTILLSPVLPLLSPAHPATAAGHTYALLQPITPPNQHPTGIASLDNSAANLPTSDRCHSLNTFHSPYSRHDTPKIRTYSTTFTTPSSLSSHAASSQPTLPLGFVTKPDSPDPDPSSIPTA